MLSQSISNLARSDVDWRRAPNHRSLRGRIGMDGTGGSTTTSGSKTFWISGIIVGTEQINHRSGGASWFRIGGGCRSIIQRVPRLGGDHAHGIGGTTRCCLIIRFEILIRNERTIGGNGAGVVNNTTAVYFQVSKIYVRGGGGGSTIMW